MLEQRTPTVEFTDPSDKVEYFENMIDDSYEVYLITWCPDPKEMPDSDIYLQHSVNVDMLAHYLTYCSAGLFCVESTQLGNPHYHGWYQVSSKYELHRIACIKTMQRFGIVKIVEAKHYKIFNWKEKGNALYYYKKDLREKFKDIHPNPIAYCDRTTVNFDTLDMVGFFSKDRKNMKSIRDVVSDRKFYREFYKDTLSGLQ